jgi:hypothetical protein
LKFGRTLAALSLVALATVGCSNRNDGESATTQAPAPVDTDAPVTSDGPDTTDAPTGPMFGTMASPCGPATDAGVPTIADGQNGGDTIKLGTANDHGYEGSPGLTIEMLDAAKAFAGWCNAQVAFVVCLWKSSILTESFLLFRQQWNKLVAKCSQWPEVAGSLMTRCTPASTNVA